MLSSAYLTLLYHDQSNVGIKYYWNSNASTDFYQITLDKLNEANNKCKGREQWHTI